MTRDSPFQIVLANGVSMLLALASAPIVARALGPVGRGETAAALAAFALVPIILAVGLPLEIRRQAATGTGADVLRSARDLFIAAVIPAALIAWALDTLVMGSLSPGARRLAALGVAFAPLTMSWSADVAVLVAHGRYRAVMAARLTQPLTFFAAALSLWLAGRLDVELVLGINIAATALTAALTASLVRISVRGSRASHRQLLRRGASYAGSSIAEAATNRLDQMLVLPLIGAQQAGIYSIAVTIAALPMAVGQALGAVYFRRVASDTRQRASHVAEGLRAAAALAFLTCAGLALLAPGAVILLFGDRFAGSVGPVLILLVGAFAMTTAYVASLMLAASGGGSRMTVAQALGVIVGTAGLYLLAPVLGAVGASVASAISYWVILIVLMHGLRTPARGLIPAPTGFREGMRALFG